MIIPVAYGLAGVVMQIIPLLGQNINKTQCVTDQKTSWLFDGWTELHKTKSVTNTHNSISVLNQDLCIEPLQFTWSRCFFIGGWRIHFVSFLQSCQLDAQWFEIVFCWCWLSECPGIWWYSCEHRKTTYCLDCPHISLYEGMSICWLFGPSVSPLLVLLQNLSGNGCK